MVIFELSPHTSESEINERAKTTCIQSTKAEDESNDAYYKSDDMLTTVIIRKVNLILHFQSELRQCEEGEESGHKHGYIEMRVIAEMEWGKVKGKQAFDKHPRQVDALDTEEATCQNNDKEGEEYRWDASQSLIESFQKEFVGTDENTLQGAIDHEVPSSTMP